MGQWARATEAVRRAIQSSEEGVVALPRRYGINPQTVTKWRKRSSVTDFSARAEESSLRCTVG